MPAWWLVGTGVGYAVSVIRSDEPLASRERYLSLNNLLWAGGIGALLWRDLYLTRAGGAWLAPRVLPATAWGARGLWAGMNFIRLDAPMALGARSGIGFGAAAGGTGAGSFIAAVASAAVVGAVVGMGISYSLWGRKGAQEAMDFYTRGAFFGTNPNYYGTADDPGYFNMYGNLKKIRANW